MYLLKHDTSCSKHNYQKLSFKSNNYTQTTFLAYIRETIQIAVISYWPSCTKHHATPPQKPKGFSICKLEKKPLQNSTVKSVILRSEVAALSPHFKSPFF